MYWTDVPRKCAIGQERAKTECEEMIQNGEAVKVFPPATRLSFLNEIEEAGAQACGVAPEWNGRQRSHSSNFCYIGEEGNKPQGIDLCESGVLLGNGCGTECPIDANDCTGSTPHFSSSKCACECDPSDPSTGRDSCTANQFFNTTTCSCEEETEESCNTIEAAWERYKARNNPPYMPRGNFGDDNEEFDSYRDSAGRCRHCCGQMSGAHGLRWAEQHCPDGFERDRCR